MKLYSADQKIRSFVRPTNPDGSHIPLPEYFGCNVFDEKAMAKRLTKDDIKALNKIQCYGGKIDESLAERIASAVRDWAVEKGATHYTHWFQPQTGSTAEKHDAFISFADNGEVVEKLSGRMLLQGEPDASSFPSGGIRTTFEARGYTGWDPGSPMFLLEKENGTTLYIPSVFVSYHGDALDHKVPLLRSDEVVAKAVRRILKQLSDKENPDRIFSTVGGEQEFFLVDKQLASQRPDLMIAGVTVLGASPAKGQELDDHYFAHIPSRVQAFFNEVEVKLYKIGVPIKTRHNEVAPGQFEVAPIFESANVASDHNHIAMHILIQVAERHGFKLLFNEKPFAKMNGSGKHLNWSLSDTSGRNYLDPGKNPQENLSFITFLCAVLKGVYEHADVLRASIASAGNDHRLGANEAPPAIMSIFLGQTLTRVLDGIEIGEDFQDDAVEKILLDFGVSTVQGLFQDNTDRNRTSPFAFTGNKFEFRAVGSTASLGYPTAILNAAVASGLNYIADEVEKVAGAGKTPATSEILSVLKKVIRDTKAIRFEGNGYSDDWRQEAAERGLSNFPNTALALQTYSDKSKTAFLSKTGILSDMDIESRAVIQYENYCKNRAVECKLAIKMVRTGILPASMEYLEDLLKNAKKSKKLSVPSPAEKMAQEIGQMTDTLYNRLRSFENKMDKIFSGNALEEEEVAKTAIKVSEVLMGSYEEMREAADALELMVPRSVWPYPKYSEMLFGIE